MRHLRAIAVLAAVLSASAAVAQTYPARPVKIIVPFAAGGPADIYARVVGEKLQAALGQSFVIEDRPGGGAIVGTDAVAKSPPDGYTLLMMSNTHTVNESLFSEKPYQLMRDLVPVAPVNYSDLVMVVHPSVPASTLAEFIALAKAKPGEMNFGSGGSGTSNHLGGELFNNVAGVKLVHVPYKGVNLAMNDVLAGNIQLVLIGIPAAAPNIKSGKLRALAVLARTRAAALPEVPTAAEAGLPDFDVTTWYGVLAPAGTPRAIVTRLNGELVRIMHAPDLKERLATLATDPVTSTPEEFAAYIKQEMARWAEIVRRTGIKAE
jgi:tripartite-type tricarboxylate transporter receptor subunit TctC